jgi:hypothetical protein
MQGAHPDPCIENNPHCDVPRASELQADGLFTSVCLGLPQATRQSHPAQGSSAAATLLQEVPLVLHLEGSVPLEATSL